MALLGGSNLCPKAIDSDIDVLIGGDKIVDKVGETFEWLWNYMYVCRIFRRNIESLS